MSGPAPAQLGYLVRQPVVLREAPDVDAPVVVELLPGASVRLAPGAAASGDWLEVVYEVAGPGDYCQQWGGWVLADGLRAAVGQATAYHRLLGPQPVPQLRVGPVVYYFPNGEGAGWRVGLN